MITRKCPQRNGGHSWVLRGTSAKDDPFDHVLRSPLWRYCNFCDLQDHETPLCEAEYRLPGSWPRYATCGKQGYVTSPYPPGLFDAINADGSPRNGNRKPDGKDHHYCRAHDPIEEARKTAEKDRKASEKYEKEKQTFYYGIYGASALEILDDLSKWAAENDDLVESDEWLCSIMKRVGPQVRKMKGL